MPELFEFNFNLTPASQEELSGIVSSVPSGWHHFGDEEDRSSVWNRAPGLSFLAPEVTWAELQYYESIPQPVTRADSRRQTTTRSSASTLGPSNMHPAPAIIDSAYVRAYAEIGPGIRFTGRQCIITDGQEAGPAEKIAICQNGPGDYLLLLCDSEWNSYACAGADTLQELVAEAERWYEGVSSQLVYTNFNAEEDRDHMHTYFKGEKCSFCGRLPNEVEHMFRAESASICSGCISRIHSSIHSSEGEA